MDSHSKTLFWYLDHLLSYKLYFFRILKGRSQLHLILAFQSSRRHRFLVHTDYYSILYTVFWWNTNMIDTKNKNPQKIDFVRSGIRTHASIWRPERPLPVYAGKVINLESGALDRSAILTTRIDW